MVITFQFGGIVIKNRSVRYMLCMIVINAVGEKIKQGRTIESTGKGQVAILSKVIRKSFIKIILSKDLRR